MYNSICMRCECVRKFKLKRALLCEECLPLESVRLSRAALELSLLHLQVNERINVGSTLFGYKMENGLCGKFTTHTCLSVILYGLPSIYKLQYKIMLIHYRLKKFNLS